MFWTALHRGHFTARIPGGACGRPGFEKMAIGRATMNSSAPNKNHPTGLPRFRFWAIAAVIAPKIRTKKMKVYGSFICLCPFDPLGFCIGNVATTAGPLGRDTSQITALAADAGVAEDSHEVGTTVGMLMEC